MSKINAQMVLKSLHRKVCSAFRKFRTYQVPNFFVEQAVSKIGKRVFPCGVFQCISWKTHAVFVYEPDLGRPTLCNAKVEQALFSKLLLTKTIIRLDLIFNATVGGNLRFGKTQVVNL